LCYHCQWLWGEYAVRRLGSFIWAIQQKIKDGNKTGHGFDAMRDTDKCMQWAFLHKLLDQNSIYPYFDEIVLSQEELKDEESIEGFLESLDNNNGQFYLKIKDDNLVSYAFYNPKRGYNEAEDENKGKLIDWKEYLKDYEGEKLQDKFDKEQFDELKRAERVFDKLQVIKEFSDIDDFREKPVCKHGVKTDGKCPSLKN
jgi:hypothetical protein